MDFPKVLDARPYEKQQFVLLYFLFLPMLIGYSCLKKVKYCK